VVSALNGLALAQGLQMGLSIHEVVNRLLD
jgi:hypothetical protein